MIVDVLDKKKFQLGNNYCEKYNDNGKLCEICEDGYFPDQNGGCSNSNKCKLSSNGDTNYLLKTIK